ncbi:MAG: hypothetical protein ACOX4D_08085 [Bacteroidales bacterium]|jgi:hypothetical protein
MKTVSRYSNIKNLDDLLAVKVELQTEIALAKGNLENSISTTKMSDYYDLVGSGVRVVNNISKKIKYVFWGYRVAKKTLKFFRRKR